ncbi:uncharacterized protein EI90DRAFT_3290747 [Cantharellus anzutake]|uniref:uncharacterized protein n=1 Tax=Cantharellus anzutake TaxID=1750568 RepID=UPI0019047FC0|nr:uncharacterized protein EI90DRAFT_3290747 [Cantharellus anzutake]KAF8327874.1 hypothetical protein EI90DRAFT_3290747 [Cantharellus anzutake]
MRFWNTLVPIGLLPVIAADFHLGQWIRITNDARWAQSWRILVPSALDLCSKIGDVVGTPDVAAIAFGGSQEVQICGVTITVSYDMMRWNSTNASGECTRIGHDPTWDVEYLHAGNDGVGAILTYLRDRSIVGIARPEELPLHVGTGHPESPYPYLLPRNTLQHDEPTEQTELHATVKRSNETKKRDLTSVHDSVTEERGKNGRNEWLLSLQRRLSTRKMDWEFWKISCGW